MPLPFSIGGGLGEHIVSLLSVLSIHLKNGFRSISFEKISVLDSYFIHRYIIIKYTNYYGSYGHFSTLKNGFQLISFEKISVLVSYFIHMYIIIKYMLSSIKGKIHQLLWEL